MQRTITKIVLVCLILVANVFGQWQPEQRLTNDPATSQMPYNNAWHVAAAGNTIHVVWYDSRDGNSEIYYKRSTDGGTTWAASPGGDTRLTTATGTSQSPAVAVSGNNVHVAWADNRDGNYEIYYKSSTDEGVTWPTSPTGDLRLTSATGNSQYPSIAVEGNNVHVVWEDYRDDASGEIYYKRSTDGGLNWGTDIRLTTSVGFASWWPSVAVKGNNVHVVWRDTRDGNIEIYYKRSTDNGTNWGSDTRLTTNTAESWNPSLAVVDDTIHVVWSDNRISSLNYEIYYKRSTDNGTNWSTDTRLTFKTTNAASHFPSIAVAGNNIHVVWQDRRLGTFNEVFYKHSTDNGMVWSADTGLTNTALEKYCPTVAVAPSGIHVVWRDLRDYSSGEIYYKRYVQSLNDVSCSKILVPALVDSGDVVVPACSVYNYGDSTENYQVRMKIGSFYNNTLPVTNHAPGTYQYLTFPNWQAIQRGNQVVSCSTELSIDMIHSNDKKIDSVMVRVLDVGVTKIEAPTGTIETGTIVTPACSVYNYGSTNESYTARMKIGTFYDNTAPVTNHAPGTYQYIEFSDWNVAELGAHAVSCSTELTNDVYQMNDKQTESVTVVAIPFQGWVAMAPVPSGLSTKRPKSGSCMAEMRGRIYFLKASNTQDFHIYEPDAGIGTWFDAETIPKGIKDEGDGKKPKRGAAMVAHRNGRSIFVLRGNNTLGFWRYQADTINDTILPGWYKMKNIPYGAKRCKYGSDLAIFRRSGNWYIFAMKGAKTDEFYIYDIEQDSWTPVSSPPIGSSGKLGYKKGSCLTYDGGEFMYVLQGYYGSFFKYSVDTDSWTELRQYDYKLFRNRDGRKKKPKDGAALEFYEDNIYMLKGGNTCEFWMYQIAMDSWIQMDTLWDIPRGLSNKKVKDGGALTILDDYFYASKGKNTDEFYRHDLPITIAANIPVQPTNDGVQENKTILDKINLTISPNPAAKITAVRYSLPKAEPVSFKLFDITGSIVKSYTNTNPTKQGVIMIDTKTLSSGVYILRFDSGDYRLTRKLVLEK